MKGLSLIIPNHNGGRVIESSIRYYNSLFSQVYDNFEMIVVCNDCTDNSVQICNQLSKEFPLKVIEIPQRGKGYAVIRGFNESRLDIIGFLDADNPFDLEKVREMVGLLYKYDMVIASKYLKGDAKLQKSQLRRFISLGGSFTSRVLFGLNFLDTQAGAKFMKKTVWDKIHRENFVCKGFEFDIELLYKTKKNNFKIKEIYTPFKDSRFSTMRLKYLPGMVKRLLKLRFLK